jgi:hypothetical protein
MTTIQIIFTTIQIVLIKIQIVLQYFNYFQIENGSNHIILSIIIRYCMLKSKK